MTGSEICYMVCEGRRDFFGAMSKGVFEIRYSEFFLLSSARCLLNFYALHATDNGQLTIKLSL